MFSGDVLNCTSRLPWKNSELIISLEIAAAWSGLMSNCFPWHVRSDVSCVDLLAARIIVATVSPVSFLSAAHELEFDWVPLFAERMNAVATVSSSLLERIYPFWRKSLREIFESEANILIIPLTVLSIFAFPLPLFLVLARYSYGLEHERRWGSCELDVGCAKSWTIRVQFSMLSGVVRSQCCYIRQSHRLLKDTGIREYENYMIKSSYRALCMFSQQLLYPSWVILQSRGHHFLALRQRQVVVHGAQEKVYGLWSTTRTLPLSAISFVVVHAGKSTHLAFSKTMKKVRLLATEHCCLLVSEFLPWFISRHQPQTNELLILRYSFIMR